MIAAAQEKKIRTSEKSNHTRSISKLNKLINAAAPMDLVLEQFQKTKDFYDRLEKAHNDFLLATDVDIDTDPTGVAYITESDEKHEEALERYANYVKADAQNQSTIATREKEAIDLQRQEETTQKIQSKRYNWNLVLLHLIR